MADVSGPHVSVEKSPVYETLQIALDNLWIQYLSLVDRYQDLRRELARDITSGHFDLAKANFSNPHRLRYGKDFYDDRMQASTRVSCAPEHWFSLVDKPGPERQDLERGEQSKSEGDAQNHPTPTESISRGNGNEVEAANAESGVRDPLIWFGILAPSTLRSSQSAFKDAVGKILKLAAVDSEMKAMEIEIRRLRKKAKKASE